MTVAAEDKTLAWRRQQLIRFFPDMPIDLVLELANGPDRELLQKAERLAGTGCPPELAYKILR